jgi:hypothetical protein
MKKILVSIANYCDPEFYQTVLSLWEQAKNKEDLYFSIVSEDNKEYDLSFIPSSQLFYRHFDLSKYRGGVCWARNLATQVSVDYDYFIQFDSHTQASSGWDEMAIERYEKLNTNGEKFIIAYAPADYEIMTDGSINLDATCKVSMYGFLFTDLVPGFKFPGYSVLEIDQIVRSYWATCCYLFAPKKWIDEVGISSKESFNTEEFALSLRTYAKDWKIYSIGTRDVFHNQSHRQANGSVTRENLRPWADERKEFYWSHVEESTNRLSLLMSGQLDIPIDKVYGFLKESGIKTKYLDFIPEYVSHVIVEPRSLGMPPRRDK